MRGLGAPLMSLSPHAPCMQIRVLGMAYGEWGKSYFGTKWFKKVDAVTFWLDRLRYLKVRNGARRRRREAGWRAAGWRWAGGPSG